LLVRSAAADEAVTSPAASRTARANFGLIIQLPGVP
jgi:hypothetical protein